MDWLYLPLLKPASAVLPQPIRRTLALHAMAAIARLPGAGQIPGLLADTTPMPELATRFGQRTLISPMGLAGGVDPDAVAVVTLGRFGFGFIEVGPYELAKSGAVPLELPKPLIAGSDLDRLSVRLQRRPPDLSIWLRVILGTDPLEAGHELRQIVQRLAGQIDAVCVTMSRAPEAPYDAKLERAWRESAAKCREAGVAIVLADLYPGTQVAVMRRLIDIGVDGFVVRHPQSSNSWTQALQTIEEARLSAHDLTVVAACGAQSPRDTIEAFEAGADLVAVDTGFIDPGPGLAKRANAAIARLMPSTTNQHSRHGLDWGAGWLWIVLLGLALLIAGTVLVVVGLTRVLLPYDEQFLGITRAQLSAINPNLLSFMRHDRLILAATSLSIGVLYTSLGWYGMRQGQTWARRAILASGAVGFASLFLFLGFHYVDPLDVGLSVGLFPLFVIGMVLGVDRHPQLSDDLDNDLAWRMGIRGQLLFVGLGVGLIVAGVTIAAFAVTRVFVFSDLAFMKTTAGKLAEANAHLLPLIAHDRAGFGGVLAADGVALLALSLWGFRRGSRWVWWALFSAGSVGFAGGLYAHILVGYLEFGHLLPLFVSGLVFVCALGCSFPYLAHKTLNG